MQKGSQLTFGWRLSQKSSLNEIEKLIALLPTPLFMVDLQSNKINQANQSACSLTGYGNDSIAGADVRTIFPNWEIDFLPVINKKIPKKTVELELIKSDQSTILVEISIYPIKPDHGLIILIISPKQNRLNTARGLPDQAYWDQWNQLARASSSTESGDYFHIAARSILSLTEASVVAIYQTSEKRSEAVLIFSQGKTDWLPKKIPADLPNPNGLHGHQPEADIWTINKRPKSELEQLAQRNKYGFLINSPLVAGTFTSAKIVIAGEQVPPDDLPHFLPAILTWVASILEQYAVEEKLKSTIQNHDRLSSLVDEVFEHIESGLIVLDPSLCIINLNASVQRILGYPRRSVIGQSIEKILIGNEDLLARFSQVQTPGAGRVNFETRLYRRNGQAFLADLALHPIISGEGLDRIVIFLKDRSAEEQARAHQIQLEQRAVLGEVVAIFAHEVRNPINNMSTGLELLQMQLQPDDPKQAAISRLIQDCNRLEDLMKSVLVYTRPAEYVLSPIQIEPFFNNLLTRLRPRIEQQGIPYSLSIEPGCPPILGNALALEQLFSNLILNAVQAMGEQSGELFIKILPHRPETQDIPATSTDGLTQFIEINIIDSGPGIPPEVQERMFQPFYTTKKTGHGLGLAIAKRIITTHKGYISVKSYPGATVFQTLIPSIQ